MVRPSSSVAGRNSAEGSQDPPALGPLADMVGFHLRLAQEASFRAFAQRVGAVYLTGGGRSLLRELTRHAVAKDRKLDRIFGAGKAQFIAALRRIGMSLG